MSQSAMLAAVVSAGVTGLVQFAIWLMFRRNWEKVDRLEGDVQTLRDKGVGSVAAMLDKCAAQTEAKLEAAASARKELHMQVGEIRETYVPRAVCGEQMRDLWAQADSFRASVARLEVVAVNSERAIRHSESVLERVLAVKTDLDRLLGRMQAGERHVG